MHRLICVICVAIVNTQSVNRSQVEVLGNARVFWPTKSTHTRTQILHALSPDKWHQRKTMAIFQLFSTRNSSSSPLWLELFSHPFPLLTLLCTASPKRLSYAATANTGLTTVQHCECAEVKSDATHARKRGGSNMACSPEDERTTPRWADEMAQSNEQRRVREYMANGDMWREWARTAWSRIVPYI